nr:MAG TPA: hypothetical protein [Bacteriophage sp.]
MWRSGNRLLNSRRLIRRLTISVTKLNRNAR